jgi:hypothetical protein
MNISIEDLRRLIFEDNKNISEIAKIYGVGPNKIKKLISSSNLPINRLKKCKTCSNSKNSSSPSELSGGMSFELTKD